MSTLSDSHRWAARAVYRSCKGVAMSLWLRNAEGERLRMLSGAGE